MLYLPGLHSERAHLSGEVHGAHILGAIAIDTVGIVASANEHGAEQHTEVKAVPLLLLEHCGRGVQEPGLAEARQLAQVGPPALPPPSSPPARDWGVSTLCQPESLVGAV